MFVWVNQKKARKEVKRVWNAFNNHEYDKMTDRESIQMFVDNLSMFAESMANIAWMLGIRDVTPPSDWNIEEDKIQIRRNDK